MAKDEQDTPGWRERRRNAKREKNARTGDSPEKRSERESGKDDVKDAASGGAVRGTLATPPSVGGMGGGL